MDKKERIKNIERQLKETDSPEEKILLLRQLNLLNHDLVVEQFKEEAYGQVSKLWKVYLRPPENTAGGINNIRSWETRKNSVINHLKENPRDFPNITEEMLQDTKLFIFKRKRQEIYDFKQRLISKMLKYHLNYKDDVEPLRNWIQKHP